MKSHNCNQKRERRMLLVFMSCWPIRSYCSILSRLYMSNTLGFSCNSTTGAVFGLQIKPAVNYEYQYHLEGRGMAPLVPRKHLQPDQDFWLANKCAWSLDHCLLKLLIAWFTVVQRSNWQLLILNIIDLLIFAVQKSPWFLDQFLKRTLIAWLHFALDHKI